MDTIEKIEEEFQKFEASNEQDIPLEFTDELGTLEERFEGLETYIQEAMMDQLLELEELKNLLVKFAQHNPKVLENDNFFKIGTHLNFLMEFHRKLEL